MKAQLVSTKSDGVTLCRPSNGYDGDNAIEIDLNDYVEVATVSGELPESDEKWPRGAPINGTVKVGDKIFRKN